MEKSDVAPRGSGQTESVRMSRAVPTEMVGQRGALS